MRKIGNLRDLSIKWRLLVICVILVSVPVACLGYVSYNTARADTIQQIENRLQQQALELKLFVSSVYSEVQANNQSTQDQAKAIVSSEAEAVYQFINTYQGDNETLKNTIAAIKVGKTGYVFVLDYSGNYVVSKGRTRDGENIWNSVDANGNYFIQSMVMKARLLTGDQIAYQIYPWQNTGETVPRDKIAGLVLIPSRQWVVGVGAYYDELVDTSFATSKIESMKNQLASIVIGKTGYVFILDKQGNYVLSYDRQRDGENIWNATDASGNHFIQTIVDQGLALPEGETAVTYYPWKNAGDSAARMKMAAYTGFPGWNWVIAASAYQDDFLDGVNLLFMTTIIVVAIAIAVGSSVAYMFASSIGRPLKLMAKQLNEVSQGNLTTAVDTSKANKSETGQMTTALATLVQNFRGLIKGVRTASESVAAMSQQVSSTAQEVNAGMEQVSSSTQQLSQGSQKLAKLAQDTAQHVSTLSTILQQTGVSTEKGLQVGKSSLEIMQQIHADSEKAIKSIEQIRNSMDNTTQTVESMHTALEKIGKLANMVTDVASQTEMLALNAAIEAARAGEAGRGFAVVADAVKELSEQSSQASNETLQSVTQVQEKGKTALDVAKSSNTQAIEGVNVVKTSIEGTKSVADSVQKINEMMNQVGDGVKKGLSAIEGVVKAVDEVSSISEESASACEENSAAMEQQTASMNQLATSASKLSDTAVQLQKELEKFKVQ
jgi:methyl-accepting chemotaxis protein